MAEGDDPWPIELYRLIPDKHAHALGMLVNHYNNAEHLLFKLVALLLKNEEGARQTINHRLNNNDRLDLLRHLAGERCAEERDRILHAVQCFEICAENRNILLHAMIEEPRAHGDQVAARKRHATKAGVEIRFDLPLEILRKTADETGAVYYYFMLLYGYLVLVFPDGIDATFRPPTLPDKPPKPNKLSLLRHP